MAIKHEKFILVPLATNTTIFIPHVQKIVNQVKSSLRKH